VTHCSRNVNRGAKARTGIGQLQTFRYLGNRAPERQVHAVDRTPTRSVIPAENSVAVLFTDGPAWGGPTPVSGTELKQRLAAILAADVAGYSRLMATDERATVAEVGGITVSDAVRGAVKSKGSASFEDPLRHTRT